LSTRLVGVVAEAGLQGVADGQWWPAEHLLEGGVDGGELARAACREQAQEHVGGRFGHAVGDQAVPVLLVGHDDSRDRSTGQLCGDPGDAGEVADGM
jgi:hypothetical protein